jgi:uncharacterized protein (TIGR02421 family)
MSHPQDKVLKKGEKPRVTTASLVDTVRDHIEKGGRLRMALPEDGRLYLERRLPFLSVYRRPVGRGDPGCEQLVTSQAAYIIGSVSEGPRSPLNAVIKEICQRCQPAFGAFLIVEVCTRPPEHPPVNPPTEVPVPAFRLFSPSQDGRADNLMDVLERELKKISVGGMKAVTEQVRRSPDYPQRPRPLLRSSDARRLKCIQISIEIEPIFQQDNVAVFPSVLKLLRRKLGYTLQRGFYHFVEHQTELRPKDYHSLGRRALVKPVWSADQKLHRIAASFDFLREVNPVNIERVWKAFKKSRYEKMPPLRYRPLSIDPSMAKRALFSIPVEEIEDPTISYLFQQRQAELDRMLTMLSDRGTKRFVLGSRQLYGNLAPSLVHAADTILERVPAYRREHTGGRRLTPRELAKLAEKEIALYQERWSDAWAPVSIRPDVIAGLMVSNGRLLVSENAAMTAKQAQALLHHEVGTHLVTFFNGRAQKLAQLASGLADYEQLQEGLAVLAEYLVGALTPGRMRTLAARVVGTRILVEGGSFIDCFRLLSRFGFRRRAAFNITVRLYRGGGLTKDCIYLRGLNEVLKYLREGGELPPLFVGKISASQIPIVSELMSRKVIIPPKIMPRYLEREDCQKRLNDLRQGIAVHDLLVLDAE